MEELRPSALFGEHVAAGATMTPFAGWNMPLRYTSDREEHRAVRESVGKFAPAPPGGGGGGGGGSGRVAGD